MFWRCTCGFLMFWGCTSGGAYYLVFTCMPGGSYCRQLRSLCLCLCDIFHVLIGFFFLLMLWEGWFPQETAMPDFYLLVVFNKFFSFPFWLVCLCLLELEDNATCQLNLSSLLWLTSYISTRWECGGRGMKVYSLEWYCVWTDTLLLYSPL